MKFCTNILVSILVSSILGWAKGVPAGTPIVNVAQLTYTVDTVDFNVTSNTVVDIVD